MRRDLVFYCRRDQRLVSRYPVLNVVPVDDMTIMDTFQPHKPSDFAWTAVLYYSTVRRWRNELLVHALIQKE